MAEELGRGNASNEVEFLKRSIGAPVPVYAVDFLGCIRWDHQQAIPRRCPTRQRFPFLVTLRS
jgi:hypothetical protein